ncbi:unnamed protein product, partial [Porites lobata]
HNTPKEVLTPFQGCRSQYPEKRFLILFGAAVTIPRKRSLLPFRAAGHNTLKRSL